MLTLDKMLSTNTRKCDCEWCTIYGPLFTKIEGLLTEEENEILNKHIGKFFQASEDAVYWKMKHEGTWGK